MADWETKTLTCNIYAAAATARTYYLDLCNVCFLFRHARLNGQRKKKKENVGWRRRAWIQPQRREEPSSFTRVLGVGVNGYPGHVIFSTFSLLLFFSAAFAQFYFLNGQEILFICEFLFWKSFRSDESHLYWREKRGCSNRSFCCYSSWPAWLRPASIPHSQVNILIVLLRYLCNRPRLLSTHDGKN